MALTFQSLYTAYQQHTSDDSTANTTIGKARINDTNKELLALHDWYFAETTFAFTPTINVYRYELPYDFGRMVTVDIDISDIHYVLEEVPSHDEWQRIQTYKDVHTSDIPEYFHVTGDYLEIYPVRSSTAASATGTFHYTKRIVDMQYDDYTTGTITLTNGDETVTGSGTTFTTAMAGRFLRGNLDARWYEIESRTDATHLELKKQFQGTTAASLAYTIGEMSLIPEEYHNLLWYLPVAQYWMMKKEPQQAAYYQALYDKGKTLFFNAYSKRSRSQLLRPRYQRYYGRQEAVGSWSDPDYD